MKRVSFSIGLSDNRGRPIPQDRITELQASSGHLINTILGGHTLMNVKGGWIDHLGKEFNEDGILIWSDIEPSRLDKVEALAVRLANMWEQEAVMVTVEPIESMRYVRSENVVQKAA